MVKYPTGKKVPEVLDPIGITLILIGSLAIGKRSTMVNTV